MATINTYAKARATTGAKLRAVTTVLISDITVLSAFRLLVTFDHVMVVNEALLDPTNWKAAGEVFDSVVSIPNIYADTADLNVLSVDAGDESETLVVELETTKQTKYGVYKIGNIGGSIAVDGTVLDPGVTYEFSGQGEPPTVAFVAASSSNSIDIEFSELMDFNSAILDPKLYEISNDLIVESVEALSPKKIRLHTSEQIAGQMYELLFAPQGVSALSEDLQILEMSPTPPSYLYQAGDMETDQTIIAKYGSNLERLTTIGTLEQNLLFQAGSPLDKQLRNSYDAFSGPGGKLDTSSAIWEFVFMGGPTFTDPNLISCIDPATGHGWIVDYLESGFGDGWRFRILNATAGKSLYASTGNKLDGSFEANHLFVSFDRTLNQLKMWVNGVNPSVDYEAGWEALDVTEGHDVLDLGDHLNFAWLGMWTFESGLGDLDDFVLARYNRLIGVY